MTVDHTAPIIQPRNRPPRRKFRFVFIAMILLGAAWTLYWMVGLKIASEALEHERLRLSNTGLSLSCKHEHWNGYPLRFAFSCNAPRLDVMNRVNVSAAGLQMFALAYKPWEFIAVVTGPTSFTSREFGKIEANHQPISANILLDANLEPALAVNIPNLSVSGLLRSDRIAIKAARGEAGLHDIAVSFANLNYQPSGRPEILIAEGDMSGVISGDGRLEVGRIELRQGKVRYWGSGEVALDESRRLQGKLATETNDLDGLLSIIEPHLDMTEQQRAGFRTILGLLGSEAKSDIIARNGELFVGPFKIADLLPVY